MEKNVYFGDVNEVYQSTVNGEDLFLTKEEAIDWTKKALEEYGLDKDAEDYVEVIDFKQLEEVDGAKRRAATDEYGNLIVEWYDDEDDEWHSCNDSVVFIP